MTKDFGSTIDASAPVSPCAEKAGHTMDRKEAFTQEAAQEMFEALRLALKRLGELNRDDEAGIRVVLANAIQKALGQ